MDLCVVDWISSSLLRPDGVLTLTSIKISERSLCFIARQQSELGSTHHLYRTEGQNVLWYRLDCQLWCQLLEIGEGTRQDGGMNVRPIFSNGRRSRVVQNGLHRGVKPVCALDSWSMAACPGVWSRSKCYIMLFHASVCEPLLGPRVPHYDLHLRSL